MKNLSSKFLTLFVIATLFLACQNETSTTVKEDKKATSVASFYTYADGSGNIFTINSKSIKYNPVTAINSSSGDYSGGDPVNKPIEQKDFVEIRKLIDVAMADTAAHIPNRVKMSGYIAAFRTGQKREKYILAPSSKSRKALEEALRNLIK